MPLQKTFIATKFKPVFKKWAKKAFKDMQNNPYDENLSLDAMMEKNAEKFADTFSGCAPEFAEALIQVLKTALVTTQSGGTGTIQ